MRKASEGLQWGISSPKQVSKLRQLLRFHRFAWVGEERPAKAGRSPSSKRLLGLRFLSNLQCIFNFNTQITGCLREGAKSYARRLHRYTPSAEFEIEQVGWKLYASGKFEICQFFLQAGEAWAPWTTAQSKERARRTTCRFPGNRLFALIDLR